MSGNDATVTCGNCGRVLDETPSLPPEQRQPCPVCGSTKRSVNVVVSAAVGVAAAINATSFITATPKTHVPTTSADQTPEAMTIRGRYRATLDWFELGGGFWLLHVLNKRGDVVEGGIGDDPEEALLEVYERLTPPSSS
jgi:hypothetical protein